MNTSIALKSRGFGKCIIERNDEIESEKLRAITIMCHHLTEELRNQYLHIESPRDLWTELKSRYTMVLLPKVRHDWMSLRFQDFEIMAEFNFALSRVVYQLRLCGKEVTDNDCLFKTYSTFHPEDLLSKHIYIERGSTTYNDLISCLTVIENDKVLKRSSEMRYPDTNKTDIDQDESKGALSNITQGVASMSID